MDKANEEVATDGEGTVLYRIVVEELRDGCSEGAGGLFLKRCSHELSETRAMRSEVVGDRVEEGVKSSSGVQRILDNVCWVLAKESTKEVMMAVRECEGENVRGAESLIEKNG